MTISSISCWTLHSITSYPSDANGNVAPIRIISESSTGLAKPSGVALDPAGDIFVANWASNNIVTVYLPSANGNATPIRTIITAGLPNASGVLLDSSGNTFVTNFALNSVTVYAPGANSNVSPINTIIGPNTALSGPYGAALDTAGNLYVANSNNNSMVYATGATGNASPSRTIIGPSTGFSSPNGVALDAVGNLYVANFSRLNFANSSITVYSPTATGDAVPIRTIMGPNTSLAGPSAIFLRP